MTRTREEILAYSKGYAAGAKGEWPAHKPPKPPDELCAKLIDVLRGMRNECDNLIATTSEGDGYEELFGPHIDAADEALAAVWQWVMDGLPEADTTAKR